MQNLLAGLSVEALLTAFALAVPDNVTLWDYDALAEASAEGAAGLALLKANVEVNNLVTAGANMLTNDTTLYATFAIVMNQAIAKKVGPPWNKVRWNIKRGKIKSH